jgi:hypothetical protein
VFKSVVPDPKSAVDANDPRKSQPFYTKDFPIQSFLWGDYAAAPGTAYRFRILPMYGKPGALTSDPQDELKLEIHTEKEWEDGARHGVWFNRGAIASQKFAEEFGNAPPKNLDDPTDPEVVWLSRGLLEACLNYIKETPVGDALRVAAYEFTYAPILNELKRAIDRGVDVQIVYHDTSDAPMTRRPPFTVRGRRSRTTSSSSVSRAAATRSRCGPARPISLPPAFSARPTSAIGSPTRRRQSSISNTGAW